MLPQKHGFVSQEEGADSYSETGLPQEMILAVFSTFFPIFYFLQWLKTTWRSQCSLQTIHTDAFCFPELYISALHESTSHQGTSKRTKQETNEMQSDQQKREAIFYLDY